MSSRYGVRWFSESKRQEVDIETMHTSFLANAYRKALRILAEPDCADPEYWRQAAEAMKEELDVRGVDPDKKPREAS